MAIEIDSHLRNHFISMYLLLLFDAILGSLTYRYLCFIIEVLWCLKKWTFLKICHTVNISINSNPSRRCYQLIKNVLGRLHVTYLIIMRYVRYCCCCIGCKESMFFFCLLSRKGEVDLSEKLLSVCHSKCVSR